MKVRVTRQDIRLGERCSNNKCPIALALRRQYPGKRWFVGLFTAMDGSAGAPKLYNLPVEACNFINDFDRGFSVKPFTFNMEPR